MDCLKALTVDFIRVTVFSFQIT